MVDDARRRTPRRQWALLLTLVLDTCIDVPPPGYKPPMPAWDAEDHEERVPVPPLLTAADLVAFEGVCRDWRAACSGHAVWRRAWEWIVWAHSDPFPQTTVYRVWNYSLSDNAFHSVNTATPSSATAEIPPRLASSSWSPSLSQAVTAANARSNWAGFCRFRVRLGVFDLKLRREGGRDVRLRWSGVGAREVEMRERELGVRFPATLKTLYSIDNIFTFLRNLHFHAFTPSNPSAVGTTGDDPHARWPRGSGLSLVPARELALVRVPRKWAHLGDAMCAVLRGGRAGRAMGVVEGWSAREEGLDGEGIVWYAIFHSSYPASDPVLLSATSETHPSRTNVAAQPGDQTIPLPPPLSFPYPRTAKTSPSRRAPTPRQSNAAPRDLAPVWPCRLSELLVYLVQDTVEGARAFGNKNAVRGVVRVAFVWTAGGDLKQAQ
ncbi:hypothetical protein HDU96_003837 [Phlyctochytrium bullatum]|nr:hypothetical protein HDU96_003837 [Phlyctochytrium bullatum]